MTDRRRERLKALGGKLAQERIDAVLLTSLPNIRYLTGFSGTSALALATATEIKLLTDFRYETQVAEEVGDVATIRIEAVSLWTGLWDVIGKMQMLEVIGFESAHMYHRDFQRLLTDGARWQWRPQLNLVETLRESKDGDEVELIREAARIATDALGRTLPQIRAGQCELEVAGILEKALRDEGSEEAPFPRCIGTAVRSAARPRIVADRRER